MTVNSCFQRCRAFFCVFRRAEISNSPLPIRYRANMDRIQCMVLKKTRVRSRAGVGM